MYSLYSRIIYQCSSSFNKQKKQAISTLTLNRKYYVKRYCTLERIRTIQIEQVQMIFLEHFLILQTQQLNNYYLVMNENNQKMLIWEGIQYFIIQGIMFFEKIELTDPFKAEAMMLFLQADTDGSKILDVNQISTILRKMKLNLSNQQIKSKVREINQQFYKAYNIKKPQHFDDSKLQIKPFEKLIKYYAFRTQLLDLFRQYCPHVGTKDKYYTTVIRKIKKYQKPIMTPQQFILFKKQEYGITITQDQAYEVISNYKDYDSKDNNNCLSFISFCNYIYSHQNSALDPAKTQIYQDMTQPMADYYIYSSHNTYLSGNQLNSDSQTLMYEQALKKGCRCVELDIHDGPNNTPIVKHGFTLTKQILFSDTIRTIFDTGFTMNDYPIVLSFQNHCGLDQQEQMAKCIQTIMGEVVYKVPLQYKDYKTYPSPASLKGCIVIKGDGKLEQLSINQNKEKPTQFHEQNIQEEESQQQSQEHQIKKIKKQKQKNKKKTSEKVKHLPRLVNLVAMFNSKIDLEYRRRHLWNVCSLSQNKAIELLKDKENQIIDYSKSFFIRTYPAGSRINSDNYDPMPMFNIGAHIIALNLQTPDRHHYLLHSRFLQNGGPECGFLLKPQWMRSTSKDPKTPGQFNQLLYHLKVNVISAQKCIVAHQEETKFRLEVYLKGNKYQQEHNKREQYAEKEKIVYDNSFNPLIGSDYNFKVYCPDLAMLVFNIVSEDGLKVLGSIGINLTLLRTGIRAVPLLGGQTMSFGKGSFLLINCKIKQPNQKNFE